MYVVAKHRGSLATNPAQSDIYVVTRVRLTFRYDEVTLNTPVNRRGCQRSANDCCSKWVAYNPSGSLLVKVGHCWFKGALLVKVGHCWSKVDVHL